MKTAGIIVAAGLSSRMGDFKPLLPYRDSTIIQSTIDTMKIAGIDIVVVVIGHNKVLIEETLKHSGVIIVYNPTYATSDMLSSVKVGLEQIIKMEEVREHINIPIESIFIMPGDMPAVSPITLIKLQNQMSHCDSKIIFPTVEGRKKHPPLIKVDLLQGIYHYEGDSGLRGALEQQEAVTSYLEVEDYGCTIDADTPEDYKRLLEYNK